MKRIMKKILELLYKAHEKGRGLTTYEIAAYLDISYTYANNNLRIMEVKKWVRRSKTPSGKTLWHITQQGVERLKAFLPQQEGFVKGDVVAE